MRLRVLRGGLQAPAFNMALDEALLLAASGPVLRLYGWRPHAVSIGYFQSVDDFADLPEGMPVVRRLTGGGAIHHGDELTFALALDAASLPAAVEASYQLLHDAVAAALRRAGIAVERLRTGRSPSPRKAARWCFQVPGRHDLVTPDGRKLVGSAQRRVRQPRPRVLHHGSIVLRRPALTPFVAAVADHADPAAAAAVLDTALPCALAEALGLVVVDDGCTAAELGLAGEIERRRQQEFVP